MPHPEDPEAEDQRLVAAAQNGDVRALEALLARHESRVLRVLRYLGIPAADRPDVAQEIFIRVFRHLGGFRRGKAFSGWIYRVTVNAAHDYRSSGGRAGGEEAPLVEEIAAPASDPAGLRRRLEAALERLTERERAVFILKEIEGLETGEIARALGVTSITVRRHLGLARTRLRSLLEKS